MHNSVSVTLQNYSANTQMYMQYVKFSLAEHSLLVVVTEVFTLRVV